MEAGSVNPSRGAFLAARDFLLDRRTDHAAAARRFRWPQSANTPISICGGLERLRRHARMERRTDPFPAAPDPGGYDSIGSCSEHAVPEPFGQGSKKRLFAFAVNGQLRTWCINRELATNRTYVSFPMLPGVKAAIRSGA
jgi:hypothetical protein